jgi:3-hydroxyacyl-[acyl-carrier-protein] dehydratase
VAVKDLIFDFSELDVSHVVADAEEIRRCNPQRHEMEQLTAIIHVDAERNASAGYKDVTQHEFWVRGHMPGMPLMPGVIMCEAAAQLASYHVNRFGLFGGSLLGLGGLEDVHFRGVVRPGDRLLIAVQLTKIRKNAMIVCRFQCFVQQSLVCDGVIKGIALPVAVLREQSTTVGQPGA